jgi:hypothetical protein
MIYGGIMKLKCKNCNNVITKNLVFLKRDYDKMTSIEISLDNDDEYLIYKRKSGFISIEKSKYRSKLPIAYILSNKDVVQDLIKHEEARGCCSYVNADIACKCGAILGTADDDCWTDEIAIILKSKVYS